MASPATLDKALLAVATAARSSEKDARRERAKAMDAIVDLLLERAEMRVLLRECLPYMWVAPASADSTADKAMMPKVVARQIERILDAQ